jgi:hypothetical protein
MERKKKEKKGKETGKMIKVQKKRSQADATYSMMVEPA